MFVFAQGSSLIYLLIYVDDMIMTGNDALLMSHIIEFLGTQFKIKNLGSLSYFLGIQVTQTTMGLFMSQEKYTTDILKDFEYLCGKSSLVPMDQHHDLLSNSDSPLIQDVTAYRRLVGRLIYLTISQPDLAYLVHVLAQYMTAPRSVHWHAALKLVRYLFRTTNQGLFMLTKLIMFSLCIVMLTGVVVNLLDNPSLDIVLRLAVRWCLGSVRSSIRCPDPLLKRSIATWLIFRLSLASWFLCYMSCMCPILHQFLCSVTTNLPCTLPPILSSMNEPSTLRSIVIWFIKISKLVSFLLSISLLMSIQLTYSLSPSPHLSWRS